MAGTPRMRRVSPSCNEAIVVPETIDCIRALTGLEQDAATSIARTDAALRIRKAFLPRTTLPIAHVTGADVAHPEMAPR